MPDETSHNDSDKAAAQRIARLELLLQLAKELRSALTMPELVRVLDQNFPGLFPGSTWDLLLADAMTADFRPIKHADELSTTGELKLLGHPEVVNLMSLGTLSDQPEPLQTCRRLHFADGTRGLLLPLIFNQRLTGIITICLQQEDADSELQDELSTVSEMIGHTLQNVQTYEQLHQQNITDDLTGLFNSRHFHHLMDYEIERSRRYGHDLSLIFIDLDYFKNVNDNHGHLVGSHVLGEVGRLFQHNMRKVNLACRYGGDEFAILLPSTSKAGAITLAGILRHALNQEIFNGGGEHKIQITASFGVASFPGDARTKESLIQLADAAMYEVKRAGRDGVRCV